MKANPILAVAAAIIFSGCAKLNIDKDAPSCIKDKIKKFNKGALCSDPSVKEYTFQGKTVYVFSDGTCGADMTSQVIDANCNNLGHLGGFAGNYTINGEDFSNAKYVKTIWQKDK